MRRARSWLCSPSLAVVAALSSACTLEGSVSRSIAASVGKGPGTRLDLAEHASFPWDRVCIIGPYTSDDDVDSLTGVRGAAAKDHGIQSNDSINVLMFVSDGRIAASVAHRRGRGDFFPELTGKCYTRDAAVFQVRDSRGNIGPD
jgi:hypothetical protein